MRKSLRSGGARLNPVNGVLCGNGREIGKRRSDGHRKVSAAARGDTHILSEYRRTFLRRHEHEAHMEGAAVGNHRIAVRSLQVVNPIRNGPEH